MATVDTSIYAGLMRPVKSVAEYNAEARQGKLAEMELEDRREERAAKGRATARQGQLQSLMKALPPGASDLERLQALRGGAFFQEADALEGGMLKRDESRAKVAKDNADTAGKKFETGQKQWQDHVTALGSFQSPGDVKNYLVGVIERADPTEQAAHIERARGMIGSIPPDPAQFDAWRTQQLQGVMSAGDQMKYKMPDANARLGSETTRRGQDKTEATARAGHAVTMRGQNMTDARAGEANSLLGKSLDVEMKRDKLNNDRSERATAKQDKLATLDNTLETLDRLEKHPGLKRSVGILSAVPTAPGGSSADFEAELGAFKSQAFLSKVSEMKGLGALTEAEGNKLVAAVGALDTKMGEKAFRASLGRIKRDFQAARQRAAGIEAGMEGGGSAKPATPSQVVRGAPKAGPGGGASIDDLVNRYTPK